MRRRRVQQALLQGCSVLSDSWGCYGEMQGVKYNSKKLLYALLKKFQVPIKRFDMPTASPALCCKFPCVHTGYWQRDESDLKSLAVDDATCALDSCRCDLRKPQRASV
jgi:hypothetical protein